MQMREVTVQRRDLTVPVQFSGVLEQFNHLLHFPRLIWVFKNHELKTHLIFIENKLFFYL